MTKAVQTFKVAGIATLRGETKVRFSDNIVRRIKQYAKAGSTRIDFIELPSEMTKIEAIKFLQAHADFQSPGDQVTLVETLEVKVKEAGKATKAVSVTKGKAKAKATVTKTKTKPTLADIKARVSKPAKAKAAPEAVAAVTE